MLSREDCVRQTLAMEAVKWLVSEELYERLAQDWTPAIKHAAEESEHALRFQARCRKELGLDPVVTVVARYIARSGAAHAVARILASHVAATRAEEGCIQFDACRSRENGDEFVLYERYRDEEAFRAHRKTPHFLTYIEEQAVPLLLERTWQRYDEIEPVAGEPTAAMLAGARRTSRRGAAPTRRRS